MNVWGVQTLLSEGPLGKSTQLSKLFSVLNNFVKNKFCHYT